MMMQRDRNIQTAATGRPAARRPARRVQGGSGPRCVGLYGATREPRNQAHGGDAQEQGGTGVVVEKARPKTRQPPLYRVVLHNDDYTPMEFVVEILLQYFSVTHEQAVQIMLTVHTRGKGVAGTYTRQIAETKVALVNDHARAHQHPLLCTMEQA